MFFYFYVIVFFIVYLSRTLLFRAVKLVPRNYEAQKTAVSSNNSLQNSGSIVEEIFDGDHNSAITESPIPSSIPSLSRMSTTDIGSTTPVSTR